MLTTPAHDPVLCSNNNNSRVAGLVVRDVPIVIIDIFQKRLSFSGHPKHEFAFLPPTAATLAPHRGDDLIVPGARQLLLCTKLRELFALPPGHDFVASCAADEVFPILAIKACK